jgi:hypothetical protein
VVHLDPKGTPFPAGPERYTSFTLVSEDGKALPSCKKAVLVLVSSSFNTGLKITPKPDGSLSYTWGDGPILVTRVGGTVVSKAIAGMRYKMLDFNEKVLAQGVVPPDGVLKIPASLPIWLTELAR